MVDAPGCWRRGAPLPAVSPYPGAPCGYCGAGPATRWRWFAHRPSTVAAPPAPTRPRQYAGPPRYPVLPRWGFVPSVWRSTAEPSPRDAVAPLRELRSVVVLGRATGAVCLLAAAAEVFRYVLLVRGRTEVLPVDQVRWSDAVVVSAGWTAVMLAVLTAVVFVPAIGRTEVWARQRAVVRATRSTAWRLFWLLTPVVTLYGAGRVLAEVDATLRLPRPATPPTATPDRLRWRSAQLPDPIATPPPVIEPAPPVPMTPQHRAPSRAVSWWWAAWVLSGLLALVTIVWALDPGDLQSRADLVQVHVLADVVAAVVAFATAAVARSWHAEMEPPADEWPTGWVPVAPAQASGSGRPPSPTTESVSSTSPLVTTQSTE